MPENTPTNQTPVFMRDYRNAVDAQWRVTVPSAWRFAERAELYIRLKEDHLVVLPRSEVERFREWANKLQGPDRTAARREWASTTDQTKIDSAGRLTFPKDWAEKVGLKTGAKALLVGAIDGFEIWAEDEFAADTNGTQARGRNLLADYD